MKASTNYLVISVLITSFALCFLTAAYPQIDVIVYGNEKCPYCRDTTKWLESQNIKYIYRDVEQFGTFQEEMFSKLEKAGYTSTAMLPVIDINGRILMKPAFDDIKNAIAGNKSGTKTEKKAREPRWRPERIKSKNTDFSSIKKNIIASDLIFYDDGTGSGSNLMKHLHREQIPFTLKQMNKLNNTAYFDMCSRLASLGYGNTVLFPVIEVRGEMIMAPSIDDVKFLLMEKISD